MDPANSSSDDTNASASTDTEVVIEAITTINDGNGVDIDGILTFIEELYEVHPDFGKRWLEDKLEDLVSQNKLEKVENRYKIFDGITTPDATMATETVSPEDSTKPQDLPSTSSTSVDMRETDDTVKALVMAENKEFEAKEAYEVADSAYQLFKESRIHLQLALEALDLCVKGEKVFLR